MSSAVVPLDLPPDGEVIWRYMSFTKFVAMLASRSLFFARSDTFMDTFESAVPQADIAGARAYFAGLMRQPVIDVDGISRFDQDGVRGYVGHFLNMSPEQQRAISDAELPSYMLRIANRFIYVNCWHRNRTESAGMWDLYLESDEGVAIRSTIGALKAALTGSSHPIYLGTVNYLDYATGSWGAYKPLHPTFHKRISFAHEQEVRAAIINPADTDARVSAGLGIPVVLNKLIHEVCVSPKSQTWFRDVVAAVLERFGHDLPLTRSDLYDTPMF